MLDAVGAYQTLAGLMLENYKIKFVGKEKGNIKSSHTQSLTASFSFEEIDHADILFIPGGENIRKTCLDEELINWIKAIDQNSDYTLAVGSGVVLLSETGVLIDRKSTSIWINEDQLVDNGANFIHDNFVMDGKYYTGKGVSAAIDIALTLISEIGGESLAKTMQLLLEYAPNPPIRSNYYLPNNDKEINITNTLLNNDNKVKEGSGEKNIVMLLYEVK